MSVAATTHDDAEHPGDRHRHAERRDAHANSHGDRQPDHEDRDAGEDRDLDDECADTVTDWLAAGATPSSSAPPSSSTSP